MPIALAPTLAAVAAPLALAAAVLAAPVAVTATVGRTDYRAEGEGRCTYAPTAYMYGKPGSMWRVSFHGRTGLRHLSLTMFKSRAGAEGVTLGLGVGDESHHLSTMPGGTPSGSATVRMQPHGTGGTFEVAGKTAEGKAVKATVRCERFEAHVAEGG